MISKNKTKNLLTILIIFSLTIEIIKAYTNQFPWFSQICSILTLITYPGIALLVGLWIKDATDSEINKFIKKSLILYISMQFIYYIINLNTIINTEEVFDLLIPHINSWMFIAIPIWCIAIPLLKKLKYPMISILFIIFVFGISPQVGNILEIKKIIQLLFFVYIGNVLKEETYQKISNKKILPILLGVFAFIATIILYNAEVGLTVYSFTSYYQIIENVITKPISLIFSLMLIAFLFKIVPSEITFKGKTILKNKIDINSMVNVWFLGGIIINIMSKFNYFNLIIGRRSLPLIVLIPILLYILITIIPFNKIKEKLKKIVRKKEFSNSKLSISIIIIIMFFLILKTLLFYNNTLYQSELESLKMIMGAIVYSGYLPFIYLLITPLFLVRNVKVRYISAILLDLIISLILIADDIYFNYASTLTSISQITNLQYTNEITAAMGELLKPIHILYFIDIIPLVIYYIIKVRKKKYSKTTFMQTITYFAMIAIILPFTIVPYVKKAKDNPYDKQRQLLNASIYGYHISDIITTSQIKKNAKYNTYEEMIIDYERLQEYYNENISENEKIKNIAQGKNVIILQLESVQNFLVNRSINNQEIIPNINKFLNENIYFSNMHVQSFSSTADSEHAAINSIYPMENGMSFSRYYMNIYDNLFSNYSNANYYTAYMHGNVGSFWNRESVYSRLEIDDLVFIDGFDDTTQRVMGYLSDEYLYRQGVEKIANYENPFMVMLVAASSHVPFELEEKYITIDVGEYKDTLFGNYIQAVHYADYAFGILIEELKEKDLYNDSVILVFGDHAGVTMYDEDIIRYLSGMEENFNDIKQQLNYTNVLCGIRIPGVEPDKINKPVSKMDIKPTLNQISGLNNKFALGTSMFNNKDYIILNNGRIITSKYYYHTGEWYNIESGNKVDLEQLEPEERERLQEYENNMNLELDISNSISINNLLKDNI